MDRQKMLELLYEALPYVQKWEQIAQAKRAPGNSVSLKVWEAIKTLEKMESEC